MRRRKTSRPQGAKQALGTLFRVKGGRSIERDSEAERESGKGIKGNKEDGKANTIRLRYSFYSSMHSQFLSPSPSSLFFSISVSLMFSLNVGLGVMGYAVQLQISGGWCVQSPRKLVTDWPEVGCSLVVVVPQAQGCRDVCVTAQWGWSAALYPRAPSPEPGDQQFSSANQKQTQAAGYASARAPPFSEIPQSGSY